MWYLQQIQLLSIILEATLNKNHEFISDSTLWPLTALYASSLIMEQSKGPYLLETAIEKTHYHVFVAWTACSNDYATMCNIGNINAVDFNHANQSTIRISKYFDTFTGAILFLQCKNLLLYDCGRGAEFVGLLISIISEVVETTKSIRPLLGIWFSDCKNCTLYSLLNLQIENLCRCSEHSFQICPKLR